MSEEQTWTWAHTETFKYLQLILEANVNFTIFMKLNE